MLRLTLYKGCRLTDNYKNVISKYKSSPLANSPLDDYLNGLTKKTIEIDKAYQEDNTIFNFLLEDTDYSTIYLYNYMKIESLDETLSRAIITRYAFINSITIKNDIGIIDYKIDIWHSFVDNILGINKSFLKGLRVINGRGGLIKPNYYKIPIEYEGNNKLNFEPVDEYTNNSNCSIILQLQVYTTASFGDATASTSRYVKISRIRTHKLIGENQWIINYKFINFGNVESIIEEIINNSAGKNFMSDDESSSNVGHETTKLYYKLGRIFVVPNSTGLSSLFETSGFKLKTTGTGIPFWETVNYYEDILLDFNDPSIENPIVLKSDSIVSNFKIKGIGFYSLFLPISVNGTSIDYEILGFCKRSEFTLLINFENKLIDITSIFELYPPTTQISGDILAQQKISRAISNLEDIGTAVKNASNFVGGIAEGRMNYEYGQNRADYYESQFVENGTGQIGMISGYKTRDSATNGMLGSIAKFVVDAVDNAIKRSARNAPIYNSTNLVKVNNIAILNALNWFGIFSINSDNDTFVKEIINNEGYNVYEIIDDISKLGFKINPNTMSEIHYNVLQFEYSDVYGNFPLNIKKQIDKILENGIKFWYYPNWTDDLYVVG